MINTFRHPLPQLPCAKCDKPLEGVPIDAGDFFYVHDDDHEPHPSVFEKEPANG